MTTRTSIWTVLRRNISYVVRGPWQLKTHQGVKNKAIKSLIIGGLKATVICESRIFTISYERFWIRNLHTKLYCYHIKLPPEAPVDLAQALAKPVYLPGFLGIHSDQSSDYMLLCSYFDLLIERMKHADPAIRRQFNDSVFDF